MNRGTIPCKYILNQEDCPYGKKCRFLHQYRGDLEKSEGHSLAGGEKVHHGERGTTERITEGRRERQKSLKERDVTGDSSEVQDSGVDSDVQVSKLSLEGQDEKLKGGGRNMSRRQTAEPKSTPRVCRFYLGHYQSHCRYGDKCRYAHTSQDRIVRGGRALNEGNKHEARKGQPIADERPTTTETLQQSSSRPIESSRQSTSRPIESSRQSSSQPIERSQQSTSQSSRQSSSQPIESSQKSSSRNPPPLTLASFIGGRPHVQRPHKSSRSQKESSTDTLREVELEQLQARFPGESCTLLTKSHDKVTYHILFQPSDPEWHGPKTVQMEVTFPRSYPKEHCHVELSSDQELSVDAIACGNKEILAYWKADMLGSLMFRPFLHWWDKSLVGILQTPFSEDVGSETSPDEGDVTDNDDDEQEETEQSGVVTKSKKGTEMRFVGLDVSQTLGTAFWTTIKVVLSCSRCKNHQEIELKEERLYSMTCGRCSNSMRVIYHLALIHISSATLGYLELTSCTPVDVIFQSSTLSLTCLNCNSEVTSQGFFVGQPKDVYCRRCHDKITINASGIKFLQHVQSDIYGPQSGPITVIPSSKQQADILFFLMKDGQPLPDYGICQHYKKSHRWLRFPCCGRAFPCDVCHDAAQDHPMERANRMICGYCSKEQGYSGKGECVRCGADLISSKNSAHWEGGQGCRNKTKMSRLDRQKHKNTEKTTCKKSERVGKIQRTDTNI